MYLLLTLSAFAGMLTGLAYLLVYGWVVAWWTPVLIFLISVVVGTTAGVLFESIVGNHVLSLLGFVGWPLCAYWMFQSIPLYLKKGVYGMRRYSSFEPNSPTPLRAPKPACKPGAFGSVSRQPAQLPGPDEPASMARPGVFGEAP